MKASKASVRYQTSPRDGHKCEGCSMWRPPASCTAVHGTISPKGWCKLWERVGAKEARS